MQRSKILLHTPCLSAQRYHAQGSDFQKNRENATMVECYFTMVGTYGFYDSIIFYNEKN